MTSKKIFTLISDNEIKSTMGENLMKREIDQKFNYLGAGSAVFYQGENTKVIKRNDVILPYHEYINHIKKTGKTLCISIGCGNAERDLPLLSILKENGIDYFYLGIDFSYDMLILAEKVMEDNNIPKNRYEFCCADIVKTDTIQHIRNYKEKFDQTLFIFLGYTFGNISHLHMVDVFHTMMDKGDMLIFDCQYMKDKSNNTLVKFFARIDSNIENQERMKLWSNALDMLGISRDKGTIGAQSQKDIVAGALVFNYFFTIHEKIQKEVNGINMYFLPNEKITFFSHRFYYLPDLESLMEEHDFYLVERNITQLQEYTGSCYYLYTK